MTPPNYENSEKWVVPPGGIIPVWMYDHVHLPVVFRHSNYRGPFNRRYVHGYVTGQRYTPPDSAVNPRNSVVSKEILESSEKDRVSRAIDVAELDKE